MIDKLKEITAHFELLEAQMADGVLINDQASYIAVAKEHRHLSPIVKKARKYILIHEQMNDDQEILDGDDDELKEIAQAEIEEFQLSLGTL
jgi:peptide chain release factor 1